MRSVSAHLTGVTKEAAGSRWSEFAEAVGSEWFFPRGTGEATLYIRFYDDLELEAEPQDLEELKVSLGRLPDVSVMADVSGRIPGDEEVRLFVELMLRHFQGVAWDDYTTHCWTLDEIKAGHLVSGHSFFGDEGWYREKSPQHVEELEEAVAAPEEGGEGDDED
ncbi:MAG: hypothetical protein ACYC67_26935 [Prosthecobacter sp.]